MPLLSRWIREREGKDIPEAPARLDLPLLPVCGNAGCKSGWVRLWRSRQVPIFEGAWTCSPACMREMVRTSVLRAWNGQEDTATLSTHQHRVPLGLMLLSRGEITHEQLKKALDAQKKSGTGRLGEWLVEQKAVTEEQVTRVLAAQWNAPVLSVEQYRPEAMALMVPRLLIDGLGALPLRVAARQLLYVAFESRIDRCVTLAVEQMSGLRVEAGILGSSLFRRLENDVLRGNFPRTRLLEASGVRGLVHAMTEMIEEKKPVEAKLVRLRDFFWLRLWLKDQKGGMSQLSDIEDMVCTFRCGNQG